MPESDEALLRRAAELVRERAMGATRGESSSGGPGTWSAWPHADYAPGETWTDEDRNDPGSVYVATDEGMDIESIATTTQPGDAAWIALVGPQCAEPLAAWLEFGADLSRHAVENGGPSDLGGAGRAIAVARALLGEPALTAPVGNDRQEGSP